MNFNPENEQILFDLRKLTLEDGKLPMTSLNQWADFTAICDSD
jgi:hypothetical protein